MRAKGGLGDAELFREKQCADAVPFQIAIDLRSEMGARVLQPVKDHQAAVIGERLDDLKWLISSQRRGEPPMSLDPAITPERIAETERLIRPHIRRTPVLRIDMADCRLSPRPVDLKLEFLQHSGSFKVRGAFTNLLTRAVPKAGVVAASGGNHGAAVAYAAMRLNVPATIFVPSVTSPAKAERIRGYGADLVIAGERYADALAAREQFVAERGALAIHAYDQPETLLGQGTAAARSSKTCRTSTRCW